MTKSLFYGLLTIGIIIAIGFFIMSSGISSTGNVVAENTIIPSGDAQIVKLSVENGNYVLTPSTFKKDVPVKIEADISKMPGCSKSVVISAFNVRKSVSEGNNLIEFTPDKAGTFNIACSMNMYKGTFTVLENDGTKPAYVQQALPSGSSCGMAGGGCGCGG